MKVDGIYYHGSPKLFDRFRSPGRVQPKMQLGFGIHLAKDRVYAQGYGKVLYRCRVRLNDAFSMLHIYELGRDRKEAEFVRRLYKRTRFADPTELAPRHGGQFVGNIDVKGPAAAVKLLEEFGYDGVLYRAKTGGPIRLHQMVFHIGRQSFQVPSESDAVVCLHPDSIEILDIESAIK